MSTPTLLHEIGLALYETPYLTVSEEREVPRTWRERLFSFPWKPWERTKTVTVRVPDLRCYVIGDIVLCHPVVAQALRESEEANRV